MQHGGAQGEQCDKALLEAALFLSAKPLSVGKLASLLGDVSPGYIDRLLEELQADLASPDRGIDLHLEKGRALLQVKRCYVEAVAHLAPHQDTPRPVLRSLAMIAYNHPMTQADLVKARGNKAYGHVQQLLERGLIRAEDHGRTLLLHVTAEFLRTFGLSSVEEFRFHTEPPPSDDTDSQDEEAATDNDPSPPSASGDHAAPDQEIDAIME